MRNFDQTLMSRRRFLQLNGTLAVALLLLATPSVRASMWSQLFGSTKRTMSPITSNDEFYITSYRTPPFVPADRWALTIRGTVISPFTLTYPDPLAQPAITEIVTLDAESLLAEQIILEGLGHTILQRLETGLLKRGAPFRKLLQRLLQQEEAHHGFGLRTLQRMLDDGPTSIDHLRELAPAYMELGKALLFSAQDSFYCIQEDPHEYWKDFQRGLPEWLREHPQDRPFLPKGLSVAR